MTRLREAVLFLLGSVWFALTSRKDNPPWNWGDTFGWRLKPYYEHLFRKTFFFASPARQQNRPNVEFAYWNPETHVVIWPAEEKITIRMGSGK